MKKRVLSLFLAITLCLTLTPTGALATDVQPSEQTVSVTQNAETPTPAPQKEEPTAPAENGADENASPASPDEKPTENTPAAPEKNPADEEPGKEPAAATRRDESKADGSPSDDDAAKVQNQLVMAAAAGPDEPTMMGQNNLPALNDAEQNAAGAQNGAGGGIYVAPGSPTEGGGGTYISGEDTRTEIWCVSKPDSIGRSYDGTTDGGTIPIGLTFTDGTNEIELKEGTGFTAKKTFDSADAGWHTVTVEIALIGEAAVKYKLKAGEEKFEIGGNINKAYPKLTVSLSQTTCTAGEKLLPLLSVEGAPKDAEVTYYYLAAELKDWAGSSDAEGGTSMPPIDGNTAISEPGTYYVYAKTGKTKNYEENRSATVALTVTEPAAASVTKADGTDGGTYKTLPAALDAAQDGDTVKLLADHTTNWSDVEASEYATLAVVKKTLTLDLNGMTVDYLTVGDVVPDEAGGILDSYNGNLTVVDNIQGGSCGKIKDLEFVKGSLTIQGGQIGGCLTCDGNSGSVTISGGTVLGLTVGEGAVVTVNGGSAHAGTWFNDGTLNITDGTFGNVEFLNNGGTIAISGGTFGTITNTNASGSIPLMPLLADNYAFYQGDNAQNGTEVTLNNVTVRPHTHSFENGKCGCGVAAIVADNNNSCYNTLQAALDAAANNASITSVTLGQDLTEDVMFSGSAAGSLTLNMNGHKLETEAGVPLTVTGGTLRIEGAGEINQNTASNANAFPAIALTGGKLVIAGDLTAQGGYDSSSGRKPAIRAEEGELDLQGNVSLNGGLTMLGNAKLTNLLTKGTFYAQDPNGNTTNDNVLAVFVQQEGAASDNYNTVLKLIADGYAIYKADGTVKNATTLTLNSDTYSIGAHTCNYTQDEAHGIAYCKCGRSHAHRDLSEEKSVLVNGICPICGYHCPHNNIGDDGVCTDCHAKMVAKVTVGETTTYTADLADALNKAANGTTITLLADTEISAYVNIYDKSATNADQMVVTLDLAGHTVTSGNPIVIGADRNGAGSHYGTLKIVGTGNITLDYVTLDTREKGVLDLTGWTGESISSVTVTRIGNRNEGKLIVGKDAGHIGRLAFIFVNCPPAEIPKTKLYGGSYGEIITTSGNTPSLAGLLPNGYAFKNADGSFAKATESNLFNVTVSACDHGGKEGFDISATTCPHCGVAAVAETALSNGQWQRFADLQTALDADRDGGAEFKLLTDVTGDYTIDGTQDTALDLNGHSIKGTVTVKGIKGDYITTTLSNTQNTTTASIDKVVAYNGAELAGSGYPAVIGTLTLAEGATWENILNLKTLGYKVLNADGTHKWYAQDDVDVNSSQLNNVIINSLPITSKTLSFKVNGTNVKGNKAERGTTVQLCASCNAKDADVSFYIGETVGNSLPIYRQKKAEYKKIGNTWYYVVDLDANTIGTYDIYFTASKDGYKVQSSEKTLTVTKATIPTSAITAPTAQENLTYTGQEQALITAGSVTDYGTMQYSLTKNGTYSQDIPTGTDAGAYTVWYRVIGDANHKDTAPASVAVRIGKKPLTIIGVTAASKTYDGTTNADISSVTFDGVNLNRGTDYTVTANFDDASVGNNKMVTATVTLMGQTAKNYALGQSSFPTTGNITKAVAPSSGPLPAVRVINNLAKTYEMVLSNDYLPKLKSPCEYGNVSYSFGGTYLADGYKDMVQAEVVEENGQYKLKLTVPAVDYNKVSSVGTLWLYVSSGNYQDFRLDIGVMTKNKDVPVPDGPISASDITYGQALNESKIAGKMKAGGKAIDGTFTWTNGTFKPAAGDYPASWTFTPAEGYEEYATATGTVTVKVKPAKLTVSVKASSMYYTGEEQIASIIASGESVDSTPVTFTYSDKKDGNYTSDGPTFTDAGTYTAYYKAEAANHEPATGTFTVTIDPLPIRLLSVSSISKTYDGSADVTLTADKLTFFSITASRQDITLPATALSFSNAQFTKQQADGSYLPSPEVGNGKALSFTMTLTSNNYVFEGKSEGTREVSDVFATDDVNRFTITKAAAPTGIQTGTLNVINGTTLEYTYDAKQILPAAPNGTYGTVLYSGKPSSNFESGYTVNSFNVGINSGVLTLTIDAQNGGKTCKIGSVTIYVTTDNYEIFNLPLDLYAVNQIKPVPDGKITASEITYGNELSASTITGTMKDPNTSAPVDGTFAWKDGTITPAANDRYEAEWTFTPDAPEYATMTGTVTIKVNKAAPTFTAPTAQENLTYTGQEQALITAGSVTSGGTMQYSLTENGTYSPDIPTGTDAGAYTVWYRVIGDANHNNTEPASVTVRIGQKPLRITGVTAASKTYDGTTNADITSVTFENVILNRGTDYTVTASFDDASVDSGKNVTATVTLMGQTAKNYFLEQSSFPTTGNITAKQVTVTGITAKDKVYDGTTNATLDCSNAKFDGILENDKLTVAAKGMFEKADIGKQKVRISDLTLGGDSVANYVLAESGNQTQTTATITAKQIAVSIKPNGGTYGETITPATATANGVVGEDALAITLTYTGTANDGTEYTGTTPPTKAGTYTITATINDPNYKLDADTATAEFTVAKRGATVTPDNKSKVYEENDPKLTYIVSGVLSGETLTGITLTRAEGENAGEYDITGTADAGANPNYEVTFADGKFTIDPKSIDGATVVLGKGLVANGAEQTQTVEKVLLGDKELPADSYTVSGNTATAHGIYTLTVTGKGNYKDSVKWTYVIAPAKAEDAPGEDIAIDRGKVKVVVLPEGSVPSVGLLTDKAELLAMLVNSGDITADELVQIANGASVDIVLTVKEANVSDVVKTAMAQAAKDYTIGQYLDISLLKYMTVNGIQQADALPTTKDALTITVGVPDALINTNSAVNRTYCIVRRHDGAITVLDAAFDAASKTLTFKTDRFSDYAIAYKDTAVPGSGSNPGSNNSSNDSETKKNEVAAPTPAPTPASTSKPSTITAMPQTGDTSNPTLYVVLLVASLLGLAVVFVCKKRNDK